jgi:hypothetical protein
MALVLVGLALVAAPSQAQAKFKLPRLKLPTVSVKLPTVRVGSGGIGVSWPKVTVRKPRPQSPPVEFQYLSGRR